MDDKIREQIKALVAKNLALESENEMLKKGAWNLCRNCRKCFRKDP